MKCQDVRRTLSLFVDGQLALTEWAIIQGHLLECAECRKELDRHRALAEVRARARLRRTTAMTAAAMAGVLAVAAVGGFFIYHESVPGLPSWATPAPPRAVVPPAPAPEVVAPAIVPAPIVRPSPPQRAKGTVEATPWGTAPPEPAVRAPRPAAAEAPTEERMPTTQARPPVVVNAPPDAEAMPTQGTARR
jgi:putative zinc finger protein